MPRSNLDPIPKEKTTIVTSKLLLDRVTNHARANGETITDFITRALMNQLENEGDYEIRFLTDTTSKIIYEEIKLF